MLHADVANANDEAQHNLRNGHVVSPWKSTIEVRTDTEAGSHETKRCNGVDLEQVVDGGTSTRPRVLVAHIVCRTARGTGHPRFDFCAALENVLVRKFLIVDRRFALESWGGQTHQRKIHRILIRRSGGLDSDNSRTPRRECAPRALFGPVVAHRADASAHSAPRRYLTDIPMRSLLYSEKNATEH